MNRRRMKEGERSITLHKRKCALFTGRVISFVDATNKRKLFMIEVWKNRCI